MICPYCNKEITLSRKVENYVAAYRNRLRLATPCCGKPVIVLPVTTVHIEQTQDYRETDDLNNPYK